MKYSIIITAYNSESYINRCLDSLVNQTKHNFKVIVIDDGSTDNTGKIVKEYKKKYKYFEYYYKENGGTAHSRNFGMSKVKTDYFIFVDSDDYVMPDLMETIEKYDNYDILSFKSYKVDDNGKILERLEKEAFDLIDGQSFFRHSFRNNSWYVVPWSYVYNTKFWRKHDLDYPNYYVLEDTSGTPIALINAKRMISIDYYGYCYVQTNESTFRTNRDQKINRNTVAYLFHYDNLNQYIKTFECSEKFKVIFRDYIANSILWYGSTLPKKHLKEFVKELKIRDVVKNLDNRDFHTNLVIKLCERNYKLYYTFRKIVEFRFNNLTGKIKMFLINSYWFCRNTASKTYWTIRKILSKIYWFCRGNLSKVYWSSRSILIKIYWLCRNSLGKVYYFLKNVLVKLYWLCRNLASKTYWFIRRIASKIYWGLRVLIIKIYWFIRNSLSKLYWSIKKVYWFFRNIINKIYWICRLSLGKVYWFFRNQISNLIKKKK